MYGYRHSNGSIMLATPTAHHSPHSVCHQPGWERAPEHDEATASDRRHRRLASVAP